MSTMSESQGIPVIFPHIAFDNTLGAELIGVLISVLLYGIFLMQVYAYNQAFQNDAKYLKYTVYALLLSTTVSTVFICHGVYFYTVTNYTNPLSLRHNVWSLTYSPILDLVTVALVEFSFAIRVYTLSGRQKKFLISIMALSLLSNGAKIVAIIEAGLHTSLGDDPGKDEQIPSCIALALSALCNCVISTLQTYYLRKKRTVIKWTNEIINVLIIYTVSTGALTSDIWIGLFCSYAQKYHILGVWFYQFRSVLERHVSFSQCRRNLQSETPAGNTVNLKDLDVETSNPSVCVSDKPRMSETVDSAAGTFYLSESTLAAHAEGQKNGL